MLLKTLSFLRDCFKQHFIGEHTKKAFDDNTILCLSCGQEAEQNPIFSSKDFVRAEEKPGKEKIKENGKFRDSENLKFEKFLTTEEDEEREFINQYANHRLHYDFEGMSKSGTRTILLAMLNILDDKFYNDNDIIPERFAC